MEHEMQFDRVFLEYLAMLGNLGRDHPETQKAMVLAFSIAPTSFAVQVASALELIGDLPEVAGYFEDGSPVFWVSQLLDHLGMTQDEACAIIGQFENTIMQMGITTDGHLVTPGAVCSVH